MKILFPLLLLLGFTPTKAQTVIELSEISHHIGDSVSVKGKIFGSKYLEGVNNTPTFINVGAAYPNQLLTVVIWGDVRKQLDYAPDDKKFTGGTAVVSGKVELFRGKPQIVIHSPEQLRIIFDEEMPQSQITANQQ